MSWPFMVRRVRGESMLPSFRPGQIVVGRRWFGRIQPGSVVIIRHGGRDKIKRVQDLRNSHIYVVGDNAQHSTDSTDFGWLEAACVQAKVIRLSKSTLLRFASFR